jgi:pimeloyl-ACP methyl ester carboxylesterase
LEVGPIKTMYALFPLHSQVLKHTNNPHNSIPDPVGTDLVASSNNFMQAEPHHMLNGGLDLHYEEQGQGRPIILLHGFGATTYTWKQVIPRLAERYKTIAFDLKGFGLSPKPSDNAYSAVDQAGLIANFIIEKGLTDVTIIGHSFGGAVGLITAMMLRAQWQQSLHSLVLIDTIAYQQPFPFFITLLRLPILGRLCMELLSEESQVAFILGIVYHDKTKITKDTIAAYAKPMKQTGAKAALIRTARLIIPPPIDEIVSSYSTIHSPTLIIHGQYDQIVPPGIGIRLANQLPNAKLIPPLPAGHAPHEEVPLLVIPEILNFLEQNE